MPKQWPIRPDNFIISWASLFPKVAEAAGEDSDGGRKITLAEFSAILGATVQAAFPIGDIKLIED